MKHFLGYRTARMLLVIITIASLSVLVLARVSSRDRLVEEYPDCPFPPLPVDYPRIITNDDAPPREEVTAYNNYWKAINKVAQFMLEDGGMRDATAEEREAYRLARDKKQYVAARELVIKVLAANPRSIPGRYILALIEHESDGNFPRALFLIRKLRRELHQRGLDKPDDEQARDWYIRILDHEFYILFDMNRDEETLRILDLIDHVYQPMAWRRIWPLMRLNRFDEARRALEQAEQSGRMKTRLANYRLVLAERSGNRKAASEAGKAMVEFGANSAVFWSNLAGLYDANFQFAEAEEARQKSISLPVDYLGSGYTYLASMYAEKGRSSEAWDALRKAQSQRLQRDAYTLIMDQNQFDHSAAFVLMLSGHAEEAHRCTRQLFEAPTRHQTSSTVRDVFFYKRFQYAVMIRNHLHQLREIEAAGGQTSREAPALMRSLRSDQWVVNRQLQTLWRDDDYLAAILRPMLPGISTPSTTFLPDLAGMLPPGVAREGLRRARQLETHEAARPYFDVVEAELDWAEGNFQRAHELAQKAIDGLSVDYERCLRARAMLVAADSLRHLGRNQEAMPLFNQALADCPAMFRLLDVPLPVAVVEDGSPLAGLLSQRVLDSPRFTGDPAGFVLTIRTVGNELTFDLFRAEQVRHCQGRVPTDLSQEEVLAAGTLRIIHKMMSPTLDLTKTDLNSLDNGLFSSPATSETDRLLRLATPRGK